MGRIALLADCHLANHRQHGGPLVEGLNERCRLALTVLKDAAVRADDGGCEAIFVLGDLFDTPRPTPQIIAAAARALGSHVQPGGALPVVLLAGNHERMSAAHADHALAPFEFMVAVGYVEQPAVERAAGRLVACAPFVPGSDAKTEIKRALALLAEKTPGNAPPVLVGHWGVGDRQTPAWLRAGSDWIDVDELSALCAARGVRQAFFGHWHTRRQWLAVGRQCAVFQLGALCPTGHDNSGLDGYGTLAMLDDKGQVELVELCGPRFVTVDNLLEVEQWVPSKHRVFLRFSTKAAVLEQARVVGDLLMREGKLAGVEVLPDAAEAGAAAERAARSARSAETLVEALAGFVRALPMPSGVDVVDVLERAQHYLGVEPAPKSAAETPTVEPAPEDAPEAPAAGGPRQAEVGRRRHRLSASSVDRALCCSWWARPDVHYKAPPPGAAAERGTLGHEIVAARLLGTRPPKCDGELQACVGHALSWWDAFTAKQTPEELLVEQPMVCAPGNGTSRLLERVGHRTYADARDDEIPGTADVLVRTGIDLVVIDWKFGTTSAVHYEAQLKTLAYGWSRLNVKVAAARVTAYVVSLDFAGAVPTCWEFSARKLQAHEQRLRALLDGLPTAEPVAGDHCNWCPAKGVCLEMGG